MIHPYRKLRVAFAAVLLCVAGCSTGGQVTGPGTSSFRLIRARITAPADAELLELTAALTNTGSTLLRSGGCLRPDLAIDVQTASGWSTLNVVQSAELVQCVQSFTVAPGATQEFTAFFSPQLGAVGAFPRNVPLRARVIPQPGSDGPTLPFTLP